MSTWHRLFCSLRGIKCSHRFSRKIRCVWHDKMSRSLETICTVSWWKSGLVFLVSPVQVIWDCLSAIPCPLYSKTGRKQLSGRNSLSSTPWCKEFPHQLNRESAHPVNSNEAGCSAVSSPPCWRRQQARKKMVAMLQALFLSISGTWTSKQFPS